MACQLSHPAIIFHRQKKAEFSPFRHPASLFLSSLQNSCHVLNGIFLPQKQEEAQSNSLVSTADIDSETVIKLVSDAVTAILTRLQSEW